MLTRIIQNSNHKYFDKKLKRIVLPIKSSISQEATPALPDTVTQRTNKQATADEATKPAPPNHAAINHSPPRPTPNATKPRARSHTPEVEKTQKETRLPHGNTNRQEQIPNPGYKYPNPKPPSHLTRPDREADPHTP